MMRISIKRQAVAAALGLLCMLGAPMASAQVTINCNDPGATGCEPCEIISALIRLTAPGSLIGNALDDDVRAFIGLLANDVADLDGDFLIDDSGSLLIATLTGDDMKDVSNQMKMLHTMMRDPSRIPAAFPFTNAQLKAAFLANREVLRAKIGPNALFLIQTLQPVIPAMTYLSMIGKPTDFANIVDDDPIVTNGRGTVGVLQALLVLLNGIELNGTPLNFASTDLQASEFQLFGEFVGANGDIDGDGFSNICEYRHFRRTLCGTVDSRVTPPAVDNSVDTVTAMLNPAIVPVGCFEVVNPSDDCRVNLTADAVVPPVAAQAIGEIRFRRFVNSQTGAQRFLANVLHTVQAVTPVMEIRRGRPGETSSTAIISLPGSPEFWEFGIGPVNAQTLKSQANYISIYSQEGDPPALIEKIRGDNDCSVLSPPAPTPHSADANRDFIIQTEEILTVIEFINAGQFSCNPGGGYRPGSGSTSCNPHNSDYNPQDFRINLPELLRLVQLFSAGSYDECPGGSEDGFCIFLD